MLEATVLNANQVVGVLLWQNLAIMDGLNGSVVVILVDLLVNCGLNVLVACRGHVLVHNSGSDLLVDGGVMLARLVPDGDDVRDVPCVFSLMLLGTATRCVDDGRYPSLMMRKGCNENREFDEGLAYMKSETAAFALSMLIELM